MYGHKHMLEYQESLTFTISTKHAVQFESMRNLQLTLYLLLCDFIEMLHDC